MADDNYHRRIREEKRSATVQAARELFLESGYDRTPLSQIAKRANVSTATLFKRFPTKAALFEAIVDEFWALDGDDDGELEVGDPPTALRSIGLDYARRMRHPEMLALSRLIVGQAQHFPDLGIMLYDNGLGPFFSRLSRYLAAESDAGTMTVDDPHFAARQFLAVIAGQSVWPELMVPGCGGNDADVTAVVDAGVDLMLLRYGTGPLRRRVSTGDGHVPSYRAVAAPL